MKRALKQQLEHVRRQAWLFETVRRLIPLPARIYQHMYFYGDISVTPDGGRRPFKLRHYGYQLENSLFWAGYGHGFEGGSLQLWAKLCRFSKTILDVGANTGVYALAAAAMRPDARVIALEPIASVFAKLKVNVELNGYAIEILRVAASDRDGKAEIFVGGSEFSYSSSLEEAMLAPGSAKTTIECCRLDALDRTLDLERIDLLKIDVEMHEPQVLVGMANILRRDRPTLLIEILDEQRSSEVYRLTNEFGYWYYFVPDRGAPEAVERPGSKYGNYLICRQDVADQLML